ncbi:YtxH domain-containing protein [Limosilactobacillus oris]|uniref:YtxH domain-containing protein n=1 Tax=Limosilactobacillus oris TaxID=1632 RepID=UPI002430972D|nr:YtxH domain-containing protein [Limosilactobacillus oris]MBS5330572.1 YtxH domain-containing protein [Limosilactobacillus oris]
MSLDLIKQYLVGIGFNVDESSLKSAKESLAQADESVKKFNDDSNKGFSETSGSLKDLFNLFASSSTLVKAMALNGPFKGLIKDISLAKKIYKEMTEIKPKEDITKTPKSKNKVKDINKFKDSSYENAKDLIKVPDNLLDKLDTKGAKKNILDFASNASKGLTDVSKTAGELLGKGGSAIKAFASTGAGSLMLIIGATVATMSAIKKLVSSLKELANDDIRFEKLSRQLWTTKENAREVGTALDTLDASMDDLWLSPTLLKQFKQLTGDLKNMELPDDFNKNIKVIQGLGLEVKRFKQMVGQFFKIIGSYILKYIAGPLDEVRGKTHSMNDWLVENLPKIAKVIGTIIGVLLRIIMIIGKILGVLWELTTPIRYIFKLIGKLGDAFTNMPEPVKKAIKIISGILMLLLSPILLIIGLIDDIMTYFRGGKSVIGSFIEKITSKSETAGKIIKGIMTTIKAILTGGLSLLPWDNYWKKAKETFENIKDKAKETWDKVKEWSEGKLDKAKDFIAGAKEKINGFNSNINNNSTASYVTTNRSTSNNTTSNSNNKVTNHNNINVYGSSDSKSTANAVSNNLTGISTRNLQGVL